MGSGSSIRGPSTWRPSTRPAEQLACRLLTRGRFVGADGSVTPAEGLYIVAATVVCGEGIERRCPTARRSRRRLRLPVTIVTPAFDGAVGAQPARMRDPSRHRHEHCVGGVCLSVVVRAPAFASAVGAQPARMVTTGGHRHEHCVGGVRLLAITAPAFDGAVCADTAAVPLARGHRQESALGLTCLFVLVVAPAVHGVIRVDRAAVGPSSGHCDDAVRARLSAQWAPAVYEAPADAVSIGAQPTGMIDRPTPLPGSSLVRSPSSSGGFATCGACCLSPTAAG